MLEMASPHEVGLLPDRWRDVLQLVESWCRRDLLPAAGLLVGRNGKTTGPHLFGKQRPQADSPPLRADAIFLIASITKPIVAMAAVRLIERGLMSLGDRVTEFLPEFGTEGKHAVTVRHLLTHTSGLPDMLPQNQQLREQHAALPTFASETCKVRLDFPAGRGVQYQSMGFAVLGEIIHRVTGRPCAQVLRDEFFEPLGMHDTALGAPAEWFAGADPKIARIAEIRVPPEYGAETDWSWNSRYWRSLGAPWGGLLTTPSDLANFAQMMLQRGRWGKDVVLSEAAVAAATSNQLLDMRDVPADDRRCRPWGLGWRLNWPSHSANFGDFLGPQTYGHWGATGTVLWIDPARDAFAIFFTTQPQEPQGTYLARLSNAVAAAWR